MKNQQLLFSLFLSIIPFLAFTQSNIQHRVTAGVSRSTLQLLMTYEAEFVSSISRGRTRSKSTRPIESRGFGIGYMAQLHRRWEVAARVNYAGNTVTEDVKILANDSRLSYEQINELRHPRKYRGLSMDGVVFWRVVSPYVTADVQVGTGISYHYYKQSYLSGYVFDLDRNIFDVQSFIEERKSNWGLPFHFQMQYPLNPAFKVGFNAHVNVYFNSNVMAGVMLFGAYRW